MGIIALRLAGGAAAVLLLSKFWFGLQNAANIGNLEYFWYGRMVFDLSMIASI
jgi:hypothetical protein